MALTGSGGPVTVTPGVGQAVCVHALKSHTLTRRLALQSACSCNGVQWTPVGAVRAEDSGDRVELAAAYLQVERGGGGLSCQVPPLLIAHDNNPIFLASCDWG